MLDLYINSNTEGQMLCELLGTHSADNLVIHKVNEKGCVVRSTLMPQEVGVG